MSTFGLRLLPTGIYTMCSLRCLRGLWWYFEIMGLRLRDDETRAEA
jgi:hypothetical protein